MIPINLVFDPKMTSDHLSVLIMLDLTPASDTESHHILFSFYLSAIGIMGTALSWFASHLTERQLFITVHNFKCSRCPSRLCPRTSSFQYLFVSLWSPLSCRWPANVHICFLHVCSSSWLLHFIYSASDYSKIIIMCFIFMKIMQKILYFLYTKYNVCVPERLDICWRGQIIFINDSEKLHRNTAERCIINKWWLSILNEKTVNLVGWCDIWLSETLPLILSEQIPAETSSPSVSRCSFYI